MKKSGELAGMSVVRGAAVRRSDVAAGAAMPSRANAASSPLNP
jgi:hypothetical protein